MNLRESISLARELGVMFRPIYRTGEMLFWVPGQRRVRINARRKDTPRSLRQLLKKVKRQERN